jgi:hypothetical protein
MQVDYSRVEKFFYGFQMLPYSFLSFSLVETAGLLGLAIFL